MEADLVLRTIERLAEKKYLPIIGPIRGKYLVDTVNKFNVKVALEVGTLIGYSAILIAKNLPEGGKLFTIESNPRIAEVAKENVGRANLFDRIEILVGNAINLIPGISVEFDMVFLDGAKDEYTAYLRASERKLRKGGVVVADNEKVFACEMRTYLDYVRTSGKYKSECLEAGSDGLEISVKL